MLRRVRTDVWEERIASIIRVTRIGELGITLAVSILHSMLRLLVTANVVLSLSILVSLVMEAIPFSETPVPTRATRRHIPEDGILHSHRRKILESYMLNH
jgi:hypothetical protein